MFCPSCGSNNQDELNYCTRCGTNLGVVSDALKGRTTDALETDERMVRLLKDYYRSRRMMLIGGVASALSLFKLAGPFLLGFPEKMIPIVILSLGFLFLGLLALVWGLIKWNNSSSELKALRVSPGKTKAVSAMPERMQLSVEPSPAGAPTAATDPIALPGSITERTTQLFDENPDEPSNLPQPTKSSIEH